MTPNRLTIAQEADRLTVAAILIKNGYTVRQGKAKRQGKNSYEYYVEYSDGKANGYDPITYPPTD